MKKISTFLALFFSASLLTGTVAFSIFNSSRDATAANDGGVQQYTVNESTYYNSISSTATGNTLGLALHNLMISTHQTYLTYGNLRYTPAVTYPDPNTSGNILSFWERTSMSSTWDSGVTWNREHVWCQSLSGGLWSGITNTDQGAGADVFHIMPANAATNSSRSNSLYAEMTEWSNENDAGFYGTTFMPTDNVKGDVARILMYVYTHYSTGFGGSTNSYTGSLPITNIVSASSEAEAWEMLLKWNYEDPVDSTEETLQEEGCQYQGNRNPFIDNPDYAPRIWGSDSNYYTTSTGVVSQSTLTLLSGNSGTISSAIKNGSGTITYSVVDGEQFASVDSSTGVVTALVPGYATIEASATIDGTTYSDTTTVRINKAVADTYSLVTSSSPVAVGDQIIFVYNDSGTYIAMQSALSGTYYMGAIEVTVASDLSTLTYNAACGLWTVEEASYSSSYFAFYNSSFSYLRGYKSGNYYDLGSATTSQDKTAAWTISTTSAGVSTVMSGASVYFKGVASWPEFAANSSAQSIYIYRKVAHRSTDATALTITGNTSRIEFGSQISDSLAVTATFSDGATDDVTSDVTISGFNNKVLGEQTITISYGNVSQNVTIYVTNVGADSTDFTSAEQASAFNTYFLSMTYGNCSDTEVWQQLCVEYEAMTSDAKSTFLAAFTTSGSYSSAYARYNYAVSNHQMDDFIFGTNKTKNTMQFASNFNEIGVIMLSLSLVSFVVFAIYIFKSKKAHKE